MKILWCITGAGHNLEECAAKIEEVSEKNVVTVAFSRAGHEVAVMYGVFDRIKRCAHEIILEEDEGASTPFVGRLPKKDFDKIIVAPCTANTTAKIAYGIADTLITSIVAQAGKAKIPARILPTDAIKVQKTNLPIWIDTNVCRNCKKCAAKKKCKQKSYYFLDRTRIDLNKCIGCKKCVTACPYKAVSFGREITIECRDIDLENTRRLSKIGGIKIILDLEGI